MSTANEYMGMLFGSKTRVELIALFVTHPGESFYVRQISTLVNLSLTPVVRELKKLERLGIVKSEVMANAKYYTVDTKCPLFPELQSMIMKTVGVGDSLRKRLGTLKNISFVFIYGSFAAGDAGPKSDVDLMIVGEVPLRVLARAIRNVEDRLHREVQYSIFDRDEFLRKVRAGDDFAIQLVESSRIMLIGEEDEFRRFIKEGE